jgi:hypothetical protein
VVSRTVRPAVAERCNDRVKFPTIGTAWQCGWEFEVLEMRGRYGWPMPPVQTKAMPVSPIFVAAVTGCMCVNIAVLVWVLAKHPALNSDFRGLWSFADFARQHPVGQIYPAAALRVFQVQLYPGFRSFFPFQYPPSFLLAILPLGDFSFAVAQIIWTASGLIALIAAGWMLFAPKLRWFAILALLASPASLLNGVAGETGYFTAAILLAGFALLPMRPVAAGIVFGLLTLKPQLGVLIPFALLARGEFRAIISACLTALALAAVSCIAFPARLWAEWPRALLVYQGQYAAAAQSGDVTLAGDLRRLGAAAGAAWGLQALIGLAGAAAVFFVFRRGPYRLAVAALFAGAGVFAPHACAYDTIPLTAAILLLQPQSAALVSLCVANYLAPFLLLTGAEKWFAYAIPEILLFLGIIYLALTTEGPSHIRHEPVPAAKPHANEC